MAEAPLEPRGLPHETGDAGGDGRARDPAAAPAGATGADPGGLASGADPSALPDLPPRRQHPAWIAISLVRQLRGFALPVLLLLIGRGRPDEGPMLLIFVGLTALAIAWQAVSWWFSRYAIVDGALHVASGVLSRQERLVPVERVQGVDLTETPLQRIFGVVGLRIETAAGGAGEADVNLRAVTRQEARAIRDRLLRAGRPAAPAAGEAAASSGEGEGVLLRRITTREVLLAGATSGRIGPALAVVTFAVQFLDDLLPDPVWRQIAEAIPGFSGRWVVVALLAAAVFAWLLSIGGAVLTWSGFELRRDGDRLLIRHGLLDRRRRSVPIARLQGVTVNEGPLRRPFGLADVRFESAGWGARAAEGGVLFPLLPAAEAPTLIAAAAPAFAPPDPLPPLTGPPPRARARYLGEALRNVAVAVAAGVVVAGVLPGAPWWWGLALAVFAPLALLDGVLGYRDTGWLLDRGRLVARAGGLVRRTTVAPLRRVQEREVRGTVFARRAGLATFVVRLASRGQGGTLTLRHLDAGQALALAEALGPAARWAAMPGAESATIAPEYT